MERLELALRRYKQLVPEAVHLHADVPLHDLQIWLREDVSPVLEDYTGRPTFREHAVWPIAKLNAGSKSGERELVDQFDSESQACAKALLRLGKQKLLLRKLHELFPPVPRVSRESVKISAKGRELKSREYSNFPQIEPLHHTLECIAHPVGQSDMVNVNDYFEPEQQWSKLPDGTCLQHGEWIVSLNSDLLPIGNFVVRCLLKRIELRIDPLVKYRSMCLRALSVLGLKYRAQLNDIEEIWRNISATNEKIAGVFRSGQLNLLRDACVAATQLHGAINPRPDLSWLPLDEATIQHGSSMLRARLSGLNNANVFDRIAVALREIGRLYTEDASAVDGIEQLIARGVLVIDEANGRVYWETKQILVPARGPKWKLLLALVRKSRRGATAGISDVYGDEAVSDTALATTWSRLKSNLPASLTKHVVPGDARSTYRLTLDPDSIHVMPQRPR